MRFLINFPQKIKENFKLTEKIKKIKESAFVKAIFPPNFKLPESLKMIEDETFIEVKLTNSFEIPKGVKLNRNQFKNSKLSLWSW